MTELTYLFAVAAALAGVMAVICVGAPRRASVKVCAVAATAAFMPVAYAAFLHLLSMPKPVALEWWHARADEATVLGSAFREGEAIYLWLQLHDTPEPRSYVLPWSRDLAEQLQTAQREAGENQGEVRMRLPFESSLDQLEPRFYAMPQLESPPKDLDGTHPQLYQRRPPSEA